MTTASPLSDLGYPDLGFPLESRSSEVGADRNDDTYNKEKVCKHRHRLP
jgi:hypothetical protein